MTIEPIKLTILHGKQCEFVTEIVGPFSISGKPEDVRSVGDAIEGSSGLMPNAIWLSVRVSGSDQQRAAVEAERKRDREDYILAEALLIQERRLLEVSDKQGDAILAATREVSGR